MRAANVQHDSTCRLDGHTLHTCTLVSQHAVQRAVETQSQRNCIALHHTGHVLSVNCAANSASMQWHRQEFERGGA